MKNPPILKKIAFLGQQIKGPQKILGNYGRSIVNYQKSSGKSTKICMNMYHEIEEKVQGKHQESTGKVL